MSKLDDNIEYWEKYYRVREQIFKTTNDVVLKNEVRMKMHLVQGFIDDLRFANDDNTSQDQALHKHDVNIRALKLAESLNRQLYNRPSSIDADGHLDIEADSKLVVGIMQKFFLEHVC